MDYEKFIINIPSYWKEIKRHPKKNTAGVDCISIKAFNDREEKLLKELLDELVSKTYSFSRLKHSPVHENGKTRDLYIPTTSDRIVLKGISKNLFEVFTGEFSNHDFSLKDKSDEERKIGVLSAVEEILLNFQNGYTWYLKLDIKDFFGSLDKNEILKRLEDKIKDKDMLGLVKQSLFLDKISEINPSKTHENKDYMIGLPQGLSISPLLASLEFTKYDHAIDNSLEDIKVIRYVDDMMILCKSQEDILKTYTFIEELLAPTNYDIYKIGENKEKTDMGNCFKKPFDFLGLHFNGNDVSISKKTLKKHELRLSKMITNQEKTLVEKIHKINLSHVSFMKQYSSDKISTKDSYIKTRENIKENFSKYLVKKGFFTKISIHIGEDKISQILDKIGLFKKL